MKFVALIAAVAFASSVSAPSITSGPSGQSSLTTPSFAFTADGADGFECSVDNGPFDACSSPHGVGPLALGQHSFSVRATGPDGPSDPVVRTWNVVASPTALPVLKIRQPAKRVRLSALRVIKGTASSPSGVLSVYVALQQGGPDTNVFPPGCIYTDLLTAKLIEQPCLLPKYAKATGTTKWHLALPERTRRALRAGTYKLIVRAFNGYDQAVRKDYKLTLR